MNKLTKPILILVMAIFGFVSVALVASAPAEASWEMRWNGKRWKMFVRPEVLAYDDIGGVGRILTTTNFVTSGGETVFADLQIDASGVIGVSTDGQSFLDLTFDPVLTDAIFASSDEYLVGSFASSLTVIEKMFAPTAMSFTEFGASRNISGFVDTVRIPEPVPMLLLPALIVIVSRMRGMA